LHEELGVVPSLKYKKEALAFAECFDVSYYSDFLINKITKERKSMSDRFVNNFLKANA